MASATTLHRVDPRTHMALRDLDPGDTSATPGGKEETRAELAVLAERLAELQGRLYARHDHSVLLILQGLDTSGKGGTVEHVLGAVNPMGLTIASFKAPSAEELSHDFLWRVHQHAPARGHIGVFDRSHYEDVLITRVEGLIGPSVWQRRYDHIKAFEQLLVDEGTTVVKVLLHISKDEQRRRLQKRLDQPEKRWKFRADDLRTREHWDDYQDAFEDMLRSTSTEHAPWHVIPADHKWYRNWAVASILVGYLEALPLEWPEPAGIDGLVIE